MSGPRFIAFGEHHGRELVGISRAGCRDQDLFLEEQSLVAGVAASDAAGLQQLRLVLHGVVLPKLTADKGISRDQVVMAYTFKTQSITGKDVYSTGPNQNSVNGAIQIAQGVPNQVLPAVCAAAGLPCSKSQTRCTRKSGDHALGRRTVVILLSSAAGAKPAR